MLKSPVLNEAHCLIETVVVDQSLAGAFADTGACTGTGDAGEAETEGEMGRISWGNRRRLTVIVMKAFLFIFVISYALSYNAVWSIGRDLQAVNARARETRQRSSCRAYQRSPADIADPLFLC
ncbi:hypothetical protein OKW98_25380 [Pseudomonas sp. KU26590]|uniref:hypothetical protein n=1 Tax=Pseudomonas sp. KU26590 TaxID=2991051 RepID=UPI00223DF0D9|nr:hypothetical protein [Pseudomonas sp. KU26590]UZJ59824.1 hypothetical protein OKW98_25380 [Pseudomonas sp. KU26590]